MCTHYIYLFRLEVIAETFFSCFLHFSCSIFYFIVSCLTGALVFGEATAINRYDIFCEYMTRWAIARMKNKRNENENKHSTNHLKITFNWTEYVNRILFAAACVSVCLCVFFYSFPSTMCMCGAEAGDGDLYFSFNSMKKNLIGAGMIEMQWHYTRYRHVYHHRSVFRFKSRVSGKKMPTTQHLTFLSIGNPCIESSNKNWRIKFSASKFPAAVLRLSAAAFILCRAGALTHLRSP